MPDHHVHLIRWKGRTARLCDGVDQRQRTFQHRETAGISHFSADQNTGTTVGNDLHIDLGLNRDASEPLPDQSLHSRRVQARYRNPPDIGQGNRSLIVNPDILKTSAAACKRGKNAPLF